MKVPNIESTPLGAGAMRQGHLPGMTGSGAAGEMAARRAGNRQDGAPRKLSESGGVYRCEGGRWRWYSTAALERAVRRADRARHSRRSRRRLAALRLAIARNLPEIAGWQVVSSLDVLR